MHRLSVLLISALLLAPVACEEKPQQTPEELAAQITKRMEEADVRQRNNKPKDAEAIYTWVLEQEANHAGALRGMAQIKLAEKDLAGAEDFANKALAANAEDVHVHSVLGTLYDKTERYTEAAGSWGKAYELEPTDARHGLKQGIALKNAKSWDEAETVLRKVAEDDPEVQFVYTELGDVLREKEQYDEALKLYMKAQTIFASDRRAHSGAAQAYESKGDTSKAINEWSSYIRQDCCSDFSNNTAKPRLEQLRQKEQGELAQDTPPAEGEAAEGDQAG